MSKYVFKSLNEKFFLKPYVLNFIFKERDCSFDLGAEMALRNNLLIIIQVQMFIVQLFIGIVPHLNPILGNQGLQGARSPYLHHLYLKNKYFEKHCRINVAQNYVFNNMFHEKKDLSLVYKTLVQLIKDARRKP